MRPEASSTRIRAHVNRSPASDPLRAIHHPIRPPPPRMGRGAGHHSRPGSINPFSATRTTSNVNSDRSVFGNFFQKSSKVTCEC